MWTMAENMLTKQSWTVVKVYQIWSVAERKQILTATEHDAAQCNAREPFCYNVSLKGLQ
jgi:hypothetical protein